MRRKKSHFPWFQVFAVSALAVVAAAVTWAAVNKVKSQREQAKAQQEERALEGAKADARKPEPREGGPSSVTAPKVETPSVPTSTELDYTHKDLLNLLSRKGLDVEMEGTGGRTVVFFIRTDDGRGELFVTRHESSEQARVRAGATTDAHLHFDRFFFYPYLPAKDPDGRRASAAQKALIMVQNALQK